MTISVVDDGNGVRFAGDWEGLADANRFLGHLRTRAFSAATVRAYAFDLVNLARLLQQRRLGLFEVTAMDVFDWIDWQRTPPPAAGTVVALRPRGAAVATVNRRVAAARGFFGFLVADGVLRLSGATGTPRREQADTRCISPRAGRLRGGHLAAGCCIG